MSKVPAYIITGSSIVFYTKSGPKTILKEDNSYDRVYNAIKEGNWTKVESIIDKLSDIKEYAEENNTNIRVTNNAVYYNDEQLHGYLINKIVQFRNEGLPIKGLILFIENLMQNPSKRCIDSLYEFLEYKNMPIDQGDGYFYAYKAVRSNFTDKRTGTFNNNVGKIVSVPRRSVDDNPDVECSYGLHAGSIQYVQNFRRGDDKVIIVKINPANVVSVPQNDKSKLRCCEYQVVEEYTGLLSDTVYHSDNLTDYTYEDEYEDTIEDFDENDFWGNIEIETESDDDYSEFLETLNQEEEMIDYPDTFTSTELTVQTDPNYKYIYSFGKELSRQDIMSALNGLNIPYSRKTNTEKLRRKLIKNLQ